MQFLRRLLAGVTLPISRMSFVLHICQENGPISFQPGMTAPQANPHAWTTTSDVVRTFLSCLQETKCQCLITALGRTTRRNWFFHRDTNDLERE